jgi:hypothetical protein
VGFNNAGFGTLSSFFFFTQVSSLMLEQGVRKDSFISPGCFAKGRKNKNNNKKGMCYGKRARRASNQL